MTTPQPCAGTSQESNPVPDSSASNSGASTGTLSQLISSQETNSVPVISSQETNSVPVFLSEANDKAQEAITIEAGSIASPNISGDSNSNLFGARSSLVAAIRQVFSREATAPRQVETLLYYLKIASLD
jgi:hypothetical protein